MDEKKIKVDIKADLDTSEAERKAGTLTDNIRTRIEQLQKGVEEYQYHTGRIEEGARDPGRMEWTEQQERRIKGTHEYIKSHLTDVPDSLKQSMSQFEQTRERMEDLRLQGLDIGETPAAKLFRAQIGRVSDITDPQQREVARSMAGQFLRQAQREGATIERDLSRRMTEQFAEVEGLPEEERAEALGELERQFDKMTQTMAQNKQVLSELNEEWEKHDESIENRSSRLLPAYLTTAMNTVAQAGRLWADLYRAEQTMFDLGSPVGMAGSQQQLDIFRTQTLWGGGGRIGGAVAGGLGGLMFGGLPGALAGTFLGSMAGGHIGDIMGTYRTAEQQRELQIFQNIAGRSMQYADQFGGVQAQEYTLAARTGWEFDPREFRERYGRFAERYGIGRGQAGQLEMMFQEARGEGTTDPRLFEDMLQLQRATRFDPATIMALQRPTRLTGMDIGLEQASMMRVIGQRMGIDPGSQLEQEFLQNIPMYWQMAGGVYMDPDRLRDAGFTAAQTPQMLFGDEAGGIPMLREGGGQQQVFQAMQGLLTPRDRAHEALLFQAYTQSPRDDQQSFFDTLLRMREGIFGEGNLEALLRATPRGEGGEAFGFALTEDVQNVDLRRAIMRMFRTGEIGETVREFMELPPEEQRRMAEELDITDKLPPGEKFRAELETMMTDAGEALQETIISTTKEWEEYITNLMKGQEYQTALADALSSALERLEDVVSTSKWLGYEEPQRFVPGSAEYGDAPPLHRRFWDFIAGRDPRNVQHMGTEAELQEQMGITVQSNRGRTFNVIIEELDTEMPFERSSSKIHD